MTLNNYNLMLVSKLVLTIISVFSITLVIARTTSHNEDKPLCNVGLLTNAGILSRMKIVLGERCVWGKHKKVKITRPEHYFSLIFSVRVILSETATYTLI